MNRNKAENALTIEYVKTLLDYDPATGNFYWKLDRRARTGALIRAAGETAGHLEPKSRYWFIHFSAMGLVRSHRLAWFWVTGQWPTGNIDHINGDPSDNRFANLRDVPSRTNTENQLKVRSDNQLGIQGVSKKKNRYISRLRVNGQLMQLGSFMTAEEARAAYVAAKRRYHEGYTL